LKIQEDGNLPWIQVEVTFVISILFSNIHGAIRLRIQAFSMDHFLQKRPSQVNLTCRAYKEA
jgi:hypothetical protein